MREEQAGTAYQPQIQSTGTLGTKTKVLKDRHQESKPIYSHATEETFISFLGLP